MAAINAAFLFIINYLSAYENNIYNRRANKYDRAFFK